MKKYLDKENSSEIHDSFNSEDSSHKNAVDSFKNVKDSNIDLSSKNIEININGSGISVGSNNVHVKNNEKTTDLISETMSMLIKKSQARIKKNFRKIKQEGKDLYLEHVDNESFLIIHDRFNANIYRIYVKYNLDSYMHDLVDLSISEIKEEIINELEKHGIDYLIDYELECDFCGDLFFLEQKEKDICTLNVNINYSVSDFFNKKTISAKQKAYICKGIAKVVLNNKRSMALTY